MQYKILLKRTLLVIVLSGSVLSLGLIFHFVLENPIRSGSTLLTANTAAIYAQEKPVYGLPVRLRVSRINIDAAIEYVGLTPDGAMDAPKQPDNVAWFELGVRPGEGGSAVIAGHRGWKNGRVSAFDDLYKLREGDKLYVEDDKGKVASFVVRESREYDPGADASEVFGSSDGESHLNLITCEGIWDKARKSYSKRLVFFADKE